MRKLEADQLIPLGARTPDVARPKIPRGRGQIRRRKQGSAGDFQQNLRGERQRAAYGHQGSAGGNVQSRGKLQQLLAISVLTSDKNRNCQGQTRPITAFRLWFSLVQEDSR